MPAVDDEGICVRHWDWSETSQTVALFTRQHGLVRALAKGSKREKAPFSGGVELLTRAGLTMIIKPNSELATLTSWDLIEPMHAVRREFKRYAVSVYLVDIVARMVQDHDPHPELYDDLSRVLNAIGREDLQSDPPDLDALLVWFQWRVLEETGSKPEVAVDVRTGATLEPNGVLGYSAELGGLTTDPGPSAGSGVMGRGVWRVRFETLRLLRDLDAGSNALGIETPKRDLERAGALLAAHLRVLMGAEAPSMRLVFPHIADSEGSSG